MTNCVAFAEYPSVLGDPVTAEYVEQFMALLAEEWPERSDCSYRLSEDAGRYTLGSPSEDMYPAEYAAIQRAFERLRNGEGL